MSSDLPILNTPNSLASIKPTDVKTGKVHVYWAKNQPITVDEYQAPTVWPKEGQLLWRPIAIRIMGINASDDEPPEEDYAIAYTHQFVFNIPQDIGADESVFVIVVFLIKPDYDPETDEGVPPYKYSPNTYVEVDSGAIFYPDFDNTNDPSSVLGDIAAAIEAGAFPQVPMVAIDYALNSLRYDQLLNETHYNSDQEGEIFVPS